MTTPLKMAAGCHWMPLHSMYVSIPSPEACPKITEVFMNVCLQDAW